MASPNLSNSKHRVVAVIPCYNTAAHIAEVVTTTRQYVDEVIVVDASAKYFNEKKVEE